MSPLMPVSSPTDLRLVVPAVATWLAAFAALGTTPLTALLGAALAGSAGVAFLLLHWRPVRQTLGVAACSLTVGTALLCASAAAAGAGLRLHAVESGPVRSLAAERATTMLEAVIAADPRVLPGRWREMVIVRARAEAVRFHGRHTHVRVPVTLLASGPEWRGLLPSQRVRMTARLIPPRDGRLQAATAQVRGPPLAIGRPSASQRAAARIRSGLREASARLPAAQRGVLPGLVTGDTSQLDPRLAEDFRAAGLTHLMVVSGANLAILTGAVLGAARVSGAGRRLGPVLAGLVVAGFVVVARPEPSVLRATVMGLIGLVAVATGRERQGVPALSGAVILLVLLDPELARSYSFVLSVLATSGLLIVAPRWRDRLRTRMPLPLAEVLAMTAAAQVMCAPVIVMLSGQVSLVAIPANLLAAPAVAPATVLGVITAVISVVAMPVARLIVVPAGLAVGWIVWVARTGASIPYATMAWRDGALGAALLVGATVLAFVCVRKPGPRRITATLIAAVIAVSVGQRLIVPAWPPPGWLLVACDVGQGDMLVLAADRGQAVVVDAGPDPGQAGRCLRDLRIRTVPLLVLTHPHADHIGGVPGILRDRAIGTVMTSRGSNGRERRFFNPATPRPSAAGDLWTAGGLRLTVIGPAGDEQVTLGADGTSVNNISVVLLARWTTGPVGASPVSALLTGDVETRAQQDLLAAGVPPVQVLKIPHHGSAAQDAGFLSASRARIALISAGAGNDYGHPAPSLLRFLDRLSMRVYRTDRDGDIAIVRRGRELATVRRDR